MATKLVILSILLYLLYETIILHSLPKNYVGHIIIIINMIVILIVIGFIIFVDKLFLAILSVLNPEILSRFIRLSGIIQIQPNDTTENTTMHGISINDINNIRNIVLNLINSQEIWNIAMSNHRNINTNQRQERQDIENISYYVSSYEWNGMNHIWPTDNNDNLCCICLNNHINVHYEPCNHVYSCYDCATNVYQTNQSCPICRIHINSITVLRDLPNNDHDLD